MDKQKLIDEIKQKIEIRKREKATYKDSGDEASYLFVTGAISVLREVLADINCGAFE